VGGLRGASGGVVLVGPLRGEALAAWVAASCAAQGLPVKVTDAWVVERVRLLLGGEPDGAGRSANDAGPAGCRLEAPYRRDSVRVKTSGSGIASPNDSVVEDGTDDGGLAIEGDARPLSA